MTMNKQLLSLLLLLCSPFLFAQTGTFTVSLKDNALTLTGSDPVTKYTTIVLRFVKTIDENATITFYDGSGMFPLQNVSSKLSALTKDSTLVIRLARDEKSYMMEPS